MVAKVEVQIGRYACQVGAAVKATETCAWRDIKAARGRSVCELAYLQTRWPVLRGPMRSSESYVHACKINIKQRVYRCYSSAFFTKILQGSTKRINTVQDMELKHVHVTIRAAMKPQDWGASNYIHLLFYLKAWRPLKELLWLWKEFQCSELTYFLYS